jgi:hypothetical protein
MAKFTDAEWKKIAALSETSAEDFGLPRRRPTSVVIGTFNIRKLGALKKRTPQAWELLLTICRRFDMLAVQEVMDDLEGIRHLREQLGPEYGLAVSDVPGSFPGDGGNAERLAFLFNWTRIQRGELASDITYDRSKVVDTLFEHRAAYADTWRQHARDLTAWETKAAAAKAAGKRRPGKPVVQLPTFLTFIRQPYCVAFRLLARGAAKPVDMLVVNAHLLYGTNKDERRWEFDALIEWLVLRAKQRSRTYHDNILMMGDCNLEFEDSAVTRQQIDAELKALNKQKLRSKRAATVNFPLLTTHPTKGDLRTNYRLDQTYDQIAMFGFDEQLPTPAANKTAGSTPDGYDYGVFNFAQLFAQALHGKDFGDLTAAQQKRLVSKGEFDVSDHMPAWIRLGIPGA